MLLNSTLLRAPAAALISRLLSQDGKDISEAPTLCPGLTCLQETEDHTAQEAGAHGGGEVAEGPLVCVWMRGERGSPGSPSEMSLSLPGSRANLSLRGHAPSPRGSNQK